jgi:hypothetical protein
VVIIRPGVVSGVVHELAFDVAFTLLAAMERDMDATASALLAILWDECVSSIGQAQRVR